MVDLTIYSLSILFIYVLTLGITFLVINALEHLYCKCKPDYRFTDYVPKSIPALLLWPLLLPLLLIELLYISTYCLTQKLRKIL